MMFVARKSVEEKNIVCVCVCVVSLFFMEERERERERKREVRGCTIKIVYAHFKEKLY